MSAAPEAAVRDLESRVIDDHHQAVKLWLRLLACTTRVEAVIRSRLRQVLTEARQSQMTGAEITKLFEAELKAIEKQES